jgi:hypothetical protein
MSLLNANSTAADTIFGRNVVACAGTVAAEAAAVNEGDTMSLGGFGE